MKNIYRLSFILMLPLLVFVACTQFLDEVEPAQAYDGTDGCIYCHTNEARLKVLAEEAETSDAGGG